ncbi:MAG: hypothetical protein RJQ09_05765 [Cyclobacteriaceae bacterium]
MKSIKLAAYLIITSILLYSCFRPEDFPDEPRITYNDLRFIVTEPNNVQDSLSLFLDFQDGDGDIGLTSEESFAPYHDLNFIIDSAGRFVTIRGEFKLPFFVGIVIPVRVFDQNGAFLRDSILFEFTERLDEDIRTLDFNCQLYKVNTVYANENYPFTIEVNGEDINGSPLPDRFNLFAPIKDGEEVFLDTFLIQENTFNKNIHVDFLRKSRGEYTLIDLNSEFGQDANGCGIDFDSRFPIFLPEKIGKAVEGTLRYDMLSNGFGILFGNDTFKIRANIIDRNLNVSNTVESPDLTLSQIRQ